MARVAFATRATTTLPRELLHRRLVLRSTGTPLDDDGHPTAESGKEVLQALRHVVVRAVAATEDVAEEVLRRMIGVGEHPVRPEVKRNADLLQVRELELDLIVDELTERFDLDGHLRQGAARLVVDVVPGPAFVVEDLDLLVVVLDQDETERHHTARRLVHDGPDLDVMCALVRLFRGERRQVDVIHPLEEHRENRNVARFGLFGSRGLGHLSLPI
jgi:hypothetical protein